jgi:peptidoglycan hydrolase-like protein with peptidoglycan-binding domain
MPTLQIGDGGDAVMALQRTLNAVIKPVPPLRVDGDYGERTRGVVRAAQRLLALEPTGVADDLLQTALATRLAPAVATPLFPAEAIWLPRAEAEIGQKEQPASGRDNARIVAYHATTTLRARRDEVRGAPRS